MFSILISLITFIGICAGIAAGMALRKRLPEGHLTGDSRDAIKLGAGLVATMTALLLSLLIASAKSFYDTQNAELIDMCAKTVVVDRMFALYGPETKPARTMLLDRVNQMLLVIDGKTGPSTADSTSGERIYESVQQLQPTSDFQRTLQSQALNIVVELAKTRWLMSAQLGSFVSLPLLVAVIFWLVLIFASFGLFAPFNRTVLVAFGLSALSVAGAIFLMLEMYSPFHGIVKLSSIPLHQTAERLGK
jgi:hypothetical protein